MTHIQLQVGRAQQTPEQAFNNIQSLVRKCKDPALDADERDTLQEALQTIAKRINEAAVLEKGLAEAQSLLRSAAEASVEEGKPSVEEGKP